MELEEVETTIGEVSAGCDEVRRQWNETKEELKRGNDGSEDIKELLWRIELIGYSLQMIRFDLVSFRLMLLQMRLDAMEERISETERRLGWIDEETIILNEKLQENKMEVKPIEVIMTDLERTTSIMLGYSIEMALMLWENRNKSLWEKEKEKRCQ